MNIAFLRPLALATALGLGVMGNAAAAQYTALDAQASEITFGYSQMNVKMDGRFAELKATELYFDPDQPAQAKVTIEVALAGVDAGYDEANAELAKDEWLAIAAHPIATFTSKTVEPLGERRYQVTGDLSIKGISRPVTVPVTFTEDGDTGVFEGEFTFQRADFDVGEGEWRDFSIVANDIRIAFRMVAIQ